MMKGQTISGILAAVVMLALTSLTSGCERRILPTALCVTDSVRHYYPIVAGEKLNFSYVLRNIGDSPLLLDDIQPSCGCIVGKLNANVIPPHDSLIVHSPSTRQRMWGMLSTPFVCMAIYFREAWQLLSLMLMWCRRPITTPTTRRCFMSRRLLRVAWRSL